MHWILKGFLGVDDHRPFIVLERFGEDFAYITGAPQIEAHGAKRLGELGEIRVALQVDPALTLLEEQLLPLSDHPQVVVVEDDDLQG